jgi:hypothetical protein
VRLFLLVLLIAESSMAQGLKHSFTVRRMDEALPVQAAQEQDVPAQVAPVQENAPSATPPLASDAPITGTAKPLAGSGLKEQFTVRRQAGEVSAAAANRLYDAGDPLVFPNSGTTLLPLFRRIRRGQEIARSELPNNLLMIQNHDGEARTVFQTPAQVIVDVVPLYNLLRDVPDIVIPPYEEVAKPRVRRREVVAFVVVVQEEDTNRDGALSEVDRKSAFFIRRDGSELTRLVEPMQGLKQVNQVDDNRLLLMFEQTQGVIAQIYSVSPLQSVKQHRLSQLR